MQATAYSLRYAPAWWLLQRVVKAAERYYPQLMLIGFINEIYIFNFSLSFVEHGFVENKAGGRACTIYVGLTFGCT